VRETDADGIFRSQAKDVRETVVGPVDPALDGANGNALKGGDFLIAHAFRTNQQENLALPRRQFRQGR
jgi:hypothetical protein